MKKIFILLSLVICLTPPKALGQEGFPFVGEITADKVNVRSGQNKNFESIYMLNKADKIVVVGKSYSWYKIKLPIGAESYVHFNFVNVLSSTIGEVKATRLNIRAGPGNKYSVVGQLTQGTKFRIKAKDGDWLRIEPVEGIYGWVFEDYLKFVSHKIPQAKTVEPPTRNLYKLKRIREEEARKALAIKKKADEEKNKIKFQDVSLTGFVRKTEEVDPPGFAFKIVLSEDSCYYIQAPESIIGQFVDKKVKLEGLVEIPVAGLKPSVVKVKKINYIF